MAHCSRWYTPDTHASGDDISGSAPPPPPPPAHQGLYSVVKYIVVK